MNWKNIGIHALVLGIAVAVWQTIMGVTGWYADPALMNLFWVVVLVNFVVVLLALRKTASVQRYLAQVGTGTLVGILGGLIIVAGSFLFTGVIAPDYFDVQAELMAAQLEAQGQPPEAVERLMKQTAFTRTPVFAAVGGYIGTVLTSLVFSLILAAFIRKKSN